MKATAHWLELRGHTGQSLFQDWLVALLRNLLMRLPVGFLARLGLAASGIGERNADRARLYPAEDLLYGAEDNIWYRDNGDGTVTVGMTMVAAATAGQLVAFTPRRAGRVVQAGKSCATIESGKWVGPAKLAFDGEVSNANDALVANPKLANSDPYGAGGLVKVRPKGWAAARASLVSGTAVAGLYKRKMAADNFVGCP